MIENRVALVWNDDLLEYDFGPGHPLRSERCKQGVEEISKLNFVELVEPRYASEDELALFHDENYVESVKSGTAGDIDTPIFPGIYDSARLSVGATLKAVELVGKGDYKIAVNVCGGWHHAFENRARGFCVFNDIAVGVMFAKRIGYERILVLDWDVHHGDGTQRAFLKDDNVLTISIHQHPSTQYPYRTGYETENTETNLNIPLLPGIPEREILKTVLPRLPLRIKPFKPEIFFVQMGVDGHREDPMSSLDLGDVFFDAISKTTARCARNSGAPVVLLGGGGFNFPKTAFLWRRIVENFAQNM